MIQRFPKLSLAQFQMLATTLGRTCAGKPVTIGLIGPLGSGKTTFVKSFAKSLGIKKIKSPTFTIIDSYKLARQKLYHIDFYRLEKESELDPLGIIPTLKQESDLVIIEWVDKFPKLKKYCDLTIKISFGKKSDNRNVTIQNS